MFLVRLGQQIRLMSYKQNPWLKFDADVVRKDAEQEDIEEEDPDIVKQAIYMFSGSLRFMPEHEKDHVTKIENTSENRKRFGRRLNNDSIQCAQLITKNKGSYKQYMLVIQFDDSLVVASLNK